MTQKKHFPHPEGACKNKTRHAKETTMEIVPEPIHPDEVFKKLKAQIKHKTAIESLENLHEICGRHNSENNSDFTLMKIGELTEKAGGLSYRSLRGSGFHTTKYKMLIEAWAEYSDGYASRKQGTVKKLDYESLHTVHPDEVFEKLKKNCENRRSIKSLEKVHEVCRQHSMSNGLDFTVPTIAKLLKAVDGPSEGTIRCPSGLRMQTLLTSWANHSGGHTSIKQVGKYELDFKYLLLLDPEFEQWRAYGAEWIKLQKRSINVKKQAINIFFEKYIQGLGLSKDPTVLFSGTYDSKSYSDLLKKHKEKARLINIVVEFLDWVLDNYYSAEDDYGKKVVAPGFNNPFMKTKRGSNYTETNKSALPYRYIKELREILCPPQAQSFSDWKWAIENSFDNNGIGDWFEVDPTLIDREDPNCVWRKRSIPVRRCHNTDCTSRKIIGERQVFEIWSPVRSMALYVKLELPLRTSQVRWLDSGEADTWRFQNDKWDLNPSILTRGTVKHPYQKGVFRRFKDYETGLDRTGFYINTNKTADINKPEDAKGYAVPWDHPRLFPWLERLRDWQMKYNAISAPVSWKSLKMKHLAAIKDPQILEDMGEVCFLFRAAYARNREDRDKPIAASDLTPAWFKLLGELEKRVAARDDGDGRNLVFVTPNSTAGTEFPLHSLRVSLITAYAIDGDVPIAMLAKCIAGHARIIMTLYYSKAGIGRVTEVMSEAERKLADRDKESFEAFLADATYKQIEQAAAFNDPAAIQAIIDNRSRAGWVVDEKGICPLGCSGCNKGYKLLRQGKEVEDVVPVPGFPTKNCIRCRFFLTGPGFIPGLQDHFNWISYQLSEASKRYINFQQQVEELENEMMSCTESDSPFPKRAQYEKLYRHYEFEAENINKLGDDKRATLKLIKRSIEIANNPNFDDNKLSLVAVGDMDDIQVAFAEVSETHQVQVLCENATFYPETDASKPVLTRSQMIDICLEMNNMAPVFFKLRPELQHKIGNQFMRLLAIKQGSIKGAVDVIEGIKTLEEIGLLEEAKNLLENATGLSLLPSGTIQIEQISRVIGGC